MRYRYLAVALLILLALISLTSVSALSTGTVNTNRQVIAVTAVDSSLVSVAVGNKASNAAGVASYNNVTTKNTISIDFRKGYGASSYGFYPNGLTPTDKFFFRELLTLTNNSSQRQCVAVYVTSGSPADLAEIQVRTVSATPGTIGSGPKTWASTPTMGRTGCQWMEVGTQVYAVDFLWSISRTTAVSNISFAISVEARPVAW